MDQEVEEEKKSTEEEEPVKKSPPVKKVSFHHDENRKVAASTSSAQEGPLVTVNEEMGNTSKIPLYDNKKVPFVCLSEGLSKKASPCSLSSWVALSLTLDGRDKITKTIQYMCRLLSWWYSTILSSNKAALPYANLYKSLANSRKAFRLGRFMVEYYKLKQTLPQLFQASQQKSGSRNLWQYISNGFSNEMPSTTLWSTIGLSCKMIALAGFWAGDNVAYLASSGFLPPKDLYTKKAQIFSSRSYFIGAIVGFFVSWKEMKDHQIVLMDATKRVHDLISEKEEEDNDSTTEHSEQCNEALKALSEAKSKQFTLFLAVLKSACDTLVFSNNPGIDLHLRFRGKKMNEGFHCFCGLLSAGTVIFNNFPNKKIDADPTLAERRAAFRRSASSNWHAPSPLW